MAHSNRTSAVIEPIPISVIIVGSQSSPMSPEVVFTGEKIVHTFSTPEVVITRATNFNASCEKLVKEANNLYNDDQLSCFKRCEVIGFKLGSSSKGHLPRRKRCIIKPNSYYRDFLFNKCTTRMNFTLQEKLAYECLMFYSVYPQYSKEVAINYGKVCVKYHELGSSLSRFDKVIVHNHVINAFCRKLFKDRHPTVSRRHYFFSTVGDYLIGNEGSLSYQKNYCERCFKHANQCLNFMSANLIPNFLKAWDEFIGYNCHFEDFVLHYAPVPKQDKEFWSKHDDGIFVMKYLELWDPYVNMMVQFQSSNINDIRVKYVSEMIFSKHNEMKSAKELISNFDAMAIALAEAEAKKAAKKESLKGQKGVVAAAAASSAGVKAKERKAAPAAPPKFSKAARRFYNENIKECEPQRLAKVLAAAGVASRRTSEELIFQGKVTVNGAVCTSPQTKVDISKDSIYIMNRISKKPPPKLYFAVNKPKEYICSCGEESKSVVSLFNDYLKGSNKIQPGLPKPRLFTVGRLDVATSGLIIVTNDGEFAQKLAHPSSNVTKEYVVTIDGAVHEKHLIAISEGTKIDGVMCVPDLVEPLAESDTRKTRLKIVVIFISSLLYSVLFLIATLLVLLSNVVVLYPQECEKTG
ncbi:ribosomal large subunit pseudouridine synthase B [Panicum miliaceum]|uniref:Ribosomal large subunit pseudouridine synthase B n=1 Tax=Panicum miliaceum TaxID=4540 RepID=A0A3L6TM33_PANMI|nr:ribosomal large subunit pseudouridine synthase B [Panicum miliaceum]